MPKRPSYLARQFSIRLTILENTRAKVEILLTRGELDRNDIEAVYSGLFLDAFTEFEALTETLFLGLFDGSLKSAAQPANRLFRITPKSHARSIAFEGKAYVDWLPMEDKTIPRAKRFFDGANPFSCLSSQEKLDLKYAHLLRNALAHKSDAATKGFLATIGQQPLLPHEKSPAGYLRTLPQGPTGPTQFSIKLNSLKSIAQKLCL